MNAWVNTRIFGFAQACDTDENTDWTASQYVLKKTRSRIIVVLVVFLLAYSVIIGRMTHLTVAGEIAAHGEEEGGADERAPLTANAQRANIVDRNGLLLATSLQMSSLYADPKFIMDAPDAAKRLNSVFPDLAYADLLKKIGNPHKRFVWVKRNLTPKQIYAVNSLGIPGIEFLQETRRLYPQGALTAHVLGYTDIDRHGLSGLERAMEKTLAGNAEPLQTSLDIRLQHILHREVQQSMTDFNALGGAGLIMDAHTGEIQAMVSLPDFNPHDPGTGPAVDRFNRITLGAYEMGSMFKVFTAAALLDLTQTPVTTRFATTQPLYRGGFRISDYHPEPHPLSVPEILIHSSNIGAALMAEKVGTKGIKEFFGRLGLFEKPKIEIEEVARPLIPNPWRDISTDTASYGHGIAVSPLQMAAGVAAVVNGGLKVTPTLLKRAPESYTAAQPVRLMSQHTSEQVRDMMRLVVTEGTASKANAKGYRVIGKTGTAEKTLGRGYSKNAQIASFVSAFPAEDPKYVVMIMVDEPKGNKQSYGFATAGWVAAPYVGHVIRDMAPLVGIRPQQDLRLQTIKANMGLAPPPIAAPSHVGQLNQGGRLASY